MEKKYYVACIVIFVLLLSLSLFITMKCLSEYKDTTVLVKSPCENIESIAISPESNCSIWQSQKRENLNIYELFGKIQDEFLNKITLFPIILVFLCLFMPCAYLREKKRIKEDLKSGELKQNTYQYAYIGVVIIPLLFSIIFFICGFVCNNYEVVYITWNKSPLIYLLMYYMLFMISSAVLSLIIINICLICAHKLHSYVGASLLSFVVLLVVELATENVSIVPSLMNYFTMSGVDEALAYLIIPTMLLIITSIILKKIDEKEIIMT